RMRRRPRGRRAGVVGRSAPLWLIIGATVPRLHEETLRVALCAGEGSLPSRCVCADPASPDLPWAPMPPRRRPAARRRARLIAGPLVCLVALAVAAGLWFDRNSDATPARHASPRTSQPQSGTGSPTSPVRLKLTVTRMGHLPAAVQDSAVTV